MPLFAGWVRLKLSVEADDESRAADLITGLDGSTLQGGVAVDEVDLEFDLEETSEEE